eukprot:m.311966 g.311966  ORF g.311966 m.311966 type:complete len:73 (+) comp186749_c0_seq1:104-322(+)
MTQFSGCSFTGSILQRADFNNCTFSSGKTDFKDTDLTEADFQNCGGLAIVDFTGAKLKGTKFSDGIREKLGL